MPNQIAFISGNQIVGRVVAIEHSSSFPDSAGKFSTWCSGAPWQYGQHQWQGSAIYVTPVGALDASVQRCLHAYGDLEGAVRPGNVVRATVRNRRGRLVVERMVNETTRATVVGGGYAPVGAPPRIALVIAVICLVALVVALMSGALLHGVLVLGETLFVVCLDAVARVVVALLPAIMPVIFLVGIYRLIIRR